MSNFQYRGYTYRRESKLFSDDGYWHKVVDPYGVVERVPFSSSAIMTPESFQLFVDLGLPDPSKFDLSYYVNADFCVLRELMEDHGLRNLDMILVWLTLSEIKLVDMSAEWENRSNTVIGLAKRRRIIMKLITTPIYTGNPVRLSIIKRSF